MCNVKVLLQKNILVTTKINFMNCNPPLKQFYGKVYCIPFKREECIFADTTVKPECTFLIPGIRLLFADIF